jgi:hypothetical protein
MSLDHNGLNLKMIKIICDQLFFSIFIKKNLKLLLCNPIWMTNG